MKVSKWILLGAIGFLVSVGLLVSFVYYSQQVLGDQRAIFYFVILFPLGISAAVFLFKVLESYAEFVGNKGPNRLKLGGPVVLFCLVFAGGYYFYQHPPQLPSVNLGITLLDQDHPDQNLGGKIRVIDYRGNNDLDIKNNQTTLYGARPEDKLLISYNASGYELGGAGSFRVPGGGQNLTVIVREKAPELKSIAEFRATVIKDFRLYYSNATDLSVQINDKNFYLHNDSLAVAAFNAVAMRYNDAYQKLIGIRDTAFALNHKLQYVDPEDLRKLFGYFDNVHGALFGKYDKEVVATLEKSTPKQISQQTERFLKIVRQIDTATRYDLESINTEINKLEEH
jgi:hypothetical protein